MRSTMPDASHLIGDIGGTNARFALADAILGYRDAEILQCADFDSSITAIRHYLDSVDAPAPEVICLAAAGPVVDGRVSFTNNHWVLDVAELANDFGIDDIILINDFEAIAWSIPALAAEDCMTIGLPAPRSLDGPDFSVAVAGPGTGLGAVGLKKHGGQLIPIPGEGSHSGFAPENQVQIEILKALRERFSRVSFERLVSGPGIENLYWALCLVHGEHRQQPRIGLDGGYARLYRPPGEVQLAAEGPGRRAGWQHTPDERLGNTDPQGQQDSANREDREF